MSYGSEDVRVPLGHEDGVYKDWLERSAPYLAEFLGTFILTTTYLCNLSGEETWAVSSNGLMVMVLVTSLIHVSGGNLNPSVSISLFLSGRQNGIVTLRYCAVQILSAACAAAFVHLRLGSAFKIDIRPRPGFSAMDAMMVEVLFTTMICFVFLNCVASPRNNAARDQNGFAGLAIGFSFIAGGHACKGVSGSVLNPAIAFGLQLADFGTKDPNGWATIYFLWELVGAFLAAAAFRVVRPTEFIQPLAPAPMAKDLPGSPAIVAEFIGTYYVILTKAMVHKRLTANEPWAVASAMASMVYSLRGVSGAFFNPAITISVGASASGAALGFHRLATFAGAQLMGALTATSTFAIIHASAELPVRPPEIEASRGSVVLAEFLFTFVLCYVVLTTSLPDPPAVAKTGNNNISGLAVAGSYLVGGVCIGNVSGSVLNPAVALSYSGLAGITGESVCLPYIFYEVAGALAASAAYYVTHAHLHDKDIDTSEALSSAGAAA